MQQEGRDLTAASDGSHVRERSTLSSFAPRGSERDRELLITAWYARYLDRPSDPKARYWTQRLRALARADVLWSIAHTDEAHRRELEVIHVEHLGRASHRGEVVYWSPMEVESPINVKVLIGATAEYRTRLATPRPRGRGSPDRVRQSGARRDT